MEDIWCYSYSKFIG